MAPEADDLAIGHLKREFSARVSAFADSQGVTSRCDWRLDRVTIRGTAVVDELEDLLPHPPMTVPTSGLELFSCTQLAISQVSLWFLIRLRIVGS